MPSSTAFTGNVIFPDRIVAATVICRNGRIEGIAKRPPRDCQAVIDAGAGYIAPGYIDIHLHGGGGADYMDGSIDAVRTVNRTHLRHGTTTVFPTTTTGSPEEIERMLTACDAAAKSWTPGDGARIAGVHLYGPYFAGNKVGCHSRKGRRDPSPDEYTRYFASRLVRIATCAAELPGAAAFYRAARSARCLITCGHSDASWPEMAAAFANGMRHVDHFWCAMSSVASVRARLGTPMRGSMEQFVLAQKAMSTEVIADGQHLAPELLRFAYDQLGPSRLLLVTDANRAVDMAPGRYRFGPVETGSWFESNGKVGFVPGSGLASSVIGLDAAVRQMRHATNAPLEDVVRMATLTPAERTGIARSRGSIAVGKRADLLILDKAVRVRQVFLDGVRV
ncbi:MAG: amidohydrolase family protein [Acidobacteria bacterium]|nr:amidohydrolase family protein [Acidobacteriota bacterium]